MVEFLLDQEGFEAHLEYVNSDSEHLLHLASKNCNPAMFRLLLPHLQRRIHQRHGQGHTSLVRVIESHATSQNRYESAKILLLSQTSNNGVDHITDAEDNPLRLAVQLGDTEMCRLLQQSCSALKYRYSRLLAPRSGPRESSQVRLREHRCLDKIRLGLWPSVKL